MRTIHSGRSGAIALGALLALGLAGCDKAVETAGPATTDPTPTAPVTVIPSTTAAATAITGDDLLAAKVTLPKWNEGCPFGSVTMVRGEGEINRQPQQNQPILFTVVQSNLDGDPAVESAALIGCQLGEVGYSQVVAFDRDASGHIRTLGQIVVGHLWRLDASSGGGVIVDISDMQACCDTPRTWELHQTRTYRWVDGRFRQTAGPTAFSSHAKPIDLKVSVVGATWQPPKNGHVAGMVTIRVTNAGPYRSNELAIWVRDDRDDPFRYGPLVPGASVKMLIPVTTFADGGSVQILIHEMGATKDLDPTNNYVFTTPGS